MPGHRQRGLRRRLKGPLLFVLGVCVCVCEGASECQTGREYFHTYVPRKVMWGKGAGPQREVEPKYIHRLAAPGLRSSEQSHLELYLIDIFFVTVELVAG